MYGRWGIVKVTKTVETSGRFKYVSRAAVKEPDPPSPSPPSISVKNANTHLADVTRQFVASISNSSMRWGWLTVALWTVAGVPSGRRWAGPADTTSSSSSSNITGRTPRPSSRRSVWSPDPSSGRESPSRRPVRSGCGCGCERCAVGVRDSGLFIRNARCRRRTRNARQRHSPAGGFATSATPFNARPYGYYNATEHSARVLGGKLHISPPEQNPSVSMRINAFTRTRVLLETNNKYIRNNIPARQAPDVCYTFAFNYASRTERLTTY